MPEFPNRENEDIEQTAAPRILSDEPDSLLNDDPYRALFDAVDVGFCIIRVIFDTQNTPVDYYFIDANPAFERHTGLVNPVGKTALELVPGLDNFWFQTYGKVALTGEPTRFENHAPAMGRWFDVYALRVGNPEERMVALLFTESTARKEAEEALRQSEADLRKAQTLLESALSAGSIATGSFDVVNNRIVPDANLARLFSIDPDEAAGGELAVYFQAIHEDDRERVMASFAGAILRTDSYEAEYRVVLPDGSHRWLIARGKVERDANGNALSLPGVVFDVTAQTEAQQALSRQQERERARLTDIFMRAPSFMVALREPHHTFEIANLPFYQLIGRQNDFAAQALIGKTVSEMLPEMAEQGLIRLLDHVYRTGEPFIGKDTRVVFQLNGDTAEAEHFVDFTFQPTYDEDGIVSGILVHGVDLTERKRLELAQEQLLIEARTRAEREALLNRIGLAVRDSRDTDSIVQTVVNLLGEGLDVDRCYFVRYDQVRDVARVGQEWMRESANLAPLVGQRLQMSRYSVDRDPRYTSGSTHVVNDIIAFNPDDAAPLLALDVRALLRVPIEAGSQMTALAVAMSDGPRQWTPDEVRLMENAASLLRSVLELASLVQRERNIAQQLQDALRPVSPGSPPGLALASYYQPALAEASVGGDFFDVFSVETGCIALVVADLSGKGLAAASQVATVRNMLRLSLYTGETVSQAITTLHDALVEHDLLTGFATLFVGMYDQKEHTLTYVNCGQEPGLLWRADQNAVEALVPTGPVLGGFASGQFEQRTVDLLRGDVLALFTDGLTEVGPTRKELLEVEGVSALFLSCCSENRERGVSNPQAIVDTLIARVDGFAQGGVRDDIALLIGVAGSDL